MMEKVTATTKEQIRLALLALKAELGPVQLVAVSKYSHTPEILYAYEEGQRAFGENRVQDLVKKDLEIGTRAANLEWHFIGHLQRNKVKNLLSIARLKAIHSVHSLELLQKILEVRQQIPSSNNLGLFFEVNTSGEKEKSGLSSREEVEDAFKLLLPNAEKLNLVPLGLMTMAALRTDDQTLAAQNCFEKLRKMKNEIQENLGLQGLQLSMGMSGDYKVALSFGANYVRIGSQIFKNP